MKHLGKTPPFRGQNGEPVPASIAEVDYLRLGGIDQWVMIRGADRANPALILLHGGPGFSETSFFRRFNAALESSFTVVYWDQRGTGKSFDRKIPRESMTVERFLADLDELVDVIRARLDKDKVVLCGHSWGTALGALYAARFPEKVAVYVGAAQVGDWAAAEASSYAFAVAEAQRLHEDRVLKKLRAIGPPPHTPKKLFAERMAVQRLESRARGRAWWSGMQAMLGPESSLVDLPNLLRGFRFSLEAMWIDVSKMNLIELVPSLSMPVVFFVGRRDHWIPAEHSVAYFDALRAPSKQLLWFEESGHEAFADEPLKFNRAMVEMVRPLAVTRAARKSEHEHHARP